MSRKLGSKNKKTIAKLAANSEVKEIKEVETSKEEAIKQAFEEPVKA